MFRVQRVGGRHKTGFNTTANATAAALATAAAVTTAAAILDHWVMVVVMRRRRWT